MTLNLPQLEKTLCNQLCTQVKIHRRNDNVLMIENPFTFPDGDHFPIYLKESPSGFIELSDSGHTFMHLSYEHDLDSIFAGSRRELLDQILREGNISESDGALSLKVLPEEIAEAIFRLGQTLTKIYDLTFLSRERSRSTFYDNLKILVFELVDETKIQSRFTPLGTFDGTEYFVDYRIEGSQEVPIFLYGVPNQDKARLTTIMLSQFLLKKLEFESVIVYDNQEKISRRDVAWLTNVSGTAVASLNAHDDLKRKLDKLAA